MTDQDNNREDERRSQIRENMTQMLGSFHDFHTHFAALIEFSSMNLAFYGEDIFHHSISQTSGTDGQKTMHFLAQVRDPSSPFHDEDTPLLELRLNADYKLDAM